MTDPVPSAAQVGAEVIAIAARYGVPADGVRRVAGGVANDAYLLGDSLFLRVPRPTPGSAADLRKESVVIPLARSVGVHTPAIVDFDDSNTLIGTPYMVLDRIHGTDLAMLGAPRDRTGHALRQLGRDLARLHDVELATAGPLAGVMRDDDDDPRRLVEHLALEGRIDAETARWLLGWFDRLARRLPTVVPPVLLHGDVAPQNILVAATTSRYLGIVDWGDANWADPAREFAKLSLFDVVPALEGYREQRSGDEEAGAWEAGALWHHLSWALSRVADLTPRPGERHWTAPPASRLLGLLRFFADSPPAPWNALG